MANELELKLAISPEDMTRLRQHPLLVRYAEAQELPQVIHNRYFDTPDRALAQRQVAIRLRSIGDHWWQTLKIMQQHPSGLSIRDEWELPVAGPRLELAAFSSIPDELKAQLLQWGPQLKPVCETVFERTLYRVSFKKGCCFELAMDQGEIRATQGKTVRHQPISEIELELTAGDVRDLLGFAARLAKEHSLIPEPRSKLARGLALADRTPDRAVHVHLPESTPQDKSGVALAALVGACQHAVLVNSMRLLRAGRDADRVERVHQARVALRRLRTVLHQARHVMPRRATALAAPLRELGQLLGTVRDKDVLLETTLPRIIAQTPSMTLPPQYLKQLAADRKQALGELRAALASPNFGQLMVELEGFRVRLAQKKGGPWLRRARPHLKKVYGAFLETMTALHSSDMEARHQARICCKQLRYTLDMYGGLFDQTLMKAWRYRLAQLQEHLGTIHDAVVALEHLETRMPQQAVAVLAELKEASQSLMTEAQTQLTPHLDELAALPAPWKSA